jgi:ABC-type multidrug transport system fused ATPase/permease subunit
MSEGKKDEVKRPKLNKDSIRKAKGIFQYLRPYALLYFVGWLFLVLSTTAGLVFPYLMGKLLGSTVSPSDVAAPTGFLTLTSVTSVATALFILFGVQALFSFFRVVIFNNVTENSLRDLRNDAFSKMVFMPMDFFNTNKVGELTSRVSSDITQIQETLRTTIAEFFRQIVIIVGGISFLFFISWKLALIMLATVPVMALIAVFFGRYIRRLSKEAQNFSANSNAIVEEALTGIANVKAFTNEYFNINRFRKNTQEMRDLNVRSGVWRGLFVSFIIFCLFGAIVFIVWQGLLMTQGAHPELSKEGFYQFVLFTIMMGASVGSLPDLYANIQKAIGATENLMDIVNGQSELDLHPGTKKNKITGEIEFKDVKFSYPQRNDMEVLKSVSFNIQPNQTFAIVGASGSGKTTITNLLLGFYKSDVGQVLVDGVSVTDYDLNHLRENMAIVPQEVMLFSGTIQENIRFGQTDATDEQVVLAAQQANAWEFIESFPDGMQTEVGDRGIQLSGGQKQRVAIARALLKNPSILILDEATSALDSESEKLVQDALQNLMKNRTSLVIAHRLATIRKVDKILVMQNGAIVETGTHQELMQLKGNYANLVSLQLLDN